MASAQVPNWKHESLVEGPSLFVSLFSVVKQDDVVQGTLANGCNGKANKNKSNLGWSSSHEALKLFFRLAGYKQVVGVS